MGFESLIGQELIKETLGRSLLQGRVAHAYLFSGPAGSGKKTVALLFAQALNCTGTESMPCGSCLSCRKAASGNHPHLLHLHPRGASLKIEQVREIQERLHYRAEEGSWKVCLLHDAERLTLPAANSLLKILEEPPGELVFILLSSRPWSLLPTVISRCVHFSLQPLSAREIKAMLHEKFSLSPAEQEVIVELAGGNPGRAADLASRGGWAERHAQAREWIREIETGPGGLLFTRAEEISRREDLDETLDLIFVLYRQKWLDSLASAGGEASRREKICRAVLQTKDELLGNVNRRLALEALFLKMRGVV